jgi:hypothetical protein
VCTCITESPAQGLDTTFYLNDYANWTHRQLKAAWNQSNYLLTVESWAEQRSYVQNAIRNLNTTGAAFGISLWLRLQFV